MKFPPATRKDHEKFCDTEGWTRRKSARGKKGTHHDNYELALPNGEILWTRISHPVNRIDYGPGMWADILRDQLRVNEVTFTECVKNGVKPDRGGATESRGEAIPLGVVHVLTSFGVPEAEVMGMTKAEAIERMAQLYTNQA